MEGHCALVGFLDVTGPWLEPGQAARGSDGPRLADLSR